MKTFLFEIFALKPVSLFSKPKSTLAFADKDFSNIFD